MSDRMTICRQHCTDSIRLQYQGLYATFWFLFKCMAPAFALGLYELVDDLKLRPVFNLFFC